MKLSDLKPSEDTSSGRKKRKKISIIENYSNGSVPNNTEESTSKDADPHKCEPSVNHASIKREPCVNEVSTNRERSVNHAFSSVNKVSTNRERSVNHAFSSVNEVSTNRERSVNHASTEFDQNALSNFQINIGIFIIKNYTLDASKKTSRVSTFEMAQALKTTYGSIRSSILRMKKNGCFKAVFSKKNYREFTFTDSFFYYLDMLLKNTSVNEVSTNRERSVNQASTHASTECSSSSSSLLITTTTKNQEWEKINFTKLKKFGFGQPQLKQLQSKNLFQPDDVQRSIDSFAYDLEHNHVQADKPLNLFMGCAVKNGTLYVSNHYRDQLDTLMEKQLEIAQNELKRRNHLKEQLFETKFDLWMDETPDNEKRKLVPPVGEFLGQFHLAGLKEYFKTNIFQEVMNE